MRDIKFRAWFDDGEATTMIPWEALSEEDTFTIDMFNNDKFTLLQYIGLEDKDGEEIYEGDILIETITDKESDQYGIREIVSVIWSDFDCAFKLANEHDVWDIWEDPDVHVHKVIGNIYQNPGLLLL